MQIVEMIKAPLRVVYHGVLDTLANSALKKIANNKVENRPIKVGFLVQMPSVWDKEENIFEAMVEDERFEPYLILVPEYDFTNSKISDYGEDALYFIKKYDKKFLLRAYRDGRWRNLKSLNMDYIFYQRCWEKYLPKEYHTKQVIKYAKTCYVPYDYQSLILPEIYYKPSFFKNLYLFFTSNKQQLILQKNNKYKKIFYEGYPSLDKPIVYKKVSDEKLILWTPRWIDDKETGGSTFLKYWKKILSIKENNPQVDLVLRPHPLTFQNMVKNKDLTQDEVDAYKKNVTDLGVRFDDNALIKDTFSKTDILITDQSSIIITYFMIGNPMIYTANTDIDYSDEMREIIDCSYVAKNFHEVEKYVDDLLKGVDPLKEKREALSKKFVKLNENASLKICDRIAEDAGFVKQMFV
ncbi:MAG: CDP-glycerol glycerophosphotransferase family protein [Lachnospiraceae bacterium]|nr:CDP-glycerol glycerophosphotransferase family protein [Lachnospiraceae bacterium]